MSTETEGLPASGEQPRAQDTEVTPITPRNDAEAAAQEAAAKEAEAKAEADKAKEADQQPPKRNRTGEYINRLQSRVRELEADLAAVKSKKPEPSAAPTIEQHNFDVAAHSRATAEWAASQAVDAFKFQQTQEAATRRLQEVTETYNGKVAQFATQHPDFVEKVTAIPYQPSEAVQLAIMAHDNGPEIAYALANDDDLAFQLASIQPHLAAAAVDRIASRLAAAPQALQTTPAQPQAPQAAARPVSKAPPPVATVSGKSPTETPLEKLTDQQWWERRQKRAS